MNQGDDPVYYLLKSLVLFLESRYPRFKIAVLMVPFLLFGYMIAAIFKSTVIFGINSGELVFITVIGITIFIIVIIPLLDYKENSYTNYTSAPWNNQRQTIIKSTEKYIITLSRTRVATDSTGYSLAIRESGKSRIIFIAFFLTELSFKDGDDTLLLSVDRKIWSVDDLKERSDRLLAEQGYL
ncbi:MAG: hypothetical protein ACFFD4_24535 [Candidatus Odinarchaeota archaeon]